MTDLPPTAPPDPPKAPAPFWWPSARDLTIGVIFVLFSCAYWSAWQAGDHDALTGFNGAILTAFATAYGYHLGSSKGAAENRDVLNKIAATPSVSAPLATSQTVNVTRPADDDPDDLAIPKLEPKP